MLRVSPWGIWHAEFTLNGGMNVKNTTAYGSEHLQMPAICSGVIFEIKQFLLCQEMSEGPPTGHRQLSGLVSPTPYSVQEGHDLTSRTDDTVLEGSV